MFVNADGIYVTHSDYHRIRFVNTSGSNKTFWAGSTPVTVNANTVRTIIGTGGNNYQENNAPQLLALGSLSDIVVIGNLYYFTMRYNGRERLMVANDTGVAQVFDGKTVNNGQAANILFSSGGYNGSNITFSNARINDVYDLSVDAVDNTVLHFSDYANLRLRSFDLVNEKVVDRLGSGKSRWGFYGDVAKPTLEHLFYYPGGLAFNDTNRHLYFVDRSNYRIRDVDPYGLISTIIGRGNGDSTVEDDVPTNAYLRTAFNSNNSMHNGLEVLADGSVVNLNSYGHNFRIWNGSGILKSFFGTFIQNDRISTVAGDPLGGTNGTGNGPDGPALSAQLAYPNGVTYYDDGSNKYIYIADTLNHCIRQVDEAGNMTAILGTCGTSGDSGPTNIDEAALLMDRPHDIAVDSLGNLIITDSWNNKVRYWNRTLTPVTVGIVTVNSGKVSTLVCNNGLTGSASEDVFSTSARCYRPMGIDLSPDGNSLCFSNTWRHNVRCVDLTTGKIRTVAGQLESTPRAGSPVGFEQEGVPGTSSTLYYPGGVDFDANGDLYISDQYNHIIRKLKLSP